METPNSCASSPTVNRFFRFTIMIISFNRFALDMKTSNHFLTMT
ncbi:hypothetical protein CHCC15381_0044 [Bacillus paralicheniformis]|uniref:Uncharacterized protein n=1 Tax=Bacillus paralicheniformis TaxID=1648923 RepID=A0ABY3FX64_9BACI|nr:hypothetical protein CHCC15381_0044 [Bacillus paralicheniformis]